MKHTFSTVMLCTALLSTAGFFAACSSSNSTKISEPAKNTSVTEQIASDQDSVSEPEKPAPAKPESKDFQETVVYDQNGIRITALGLDEGFIGPEVKFLIENNSETSYTVQADNVSINGNMVNPIMSAEVAPGKKANDGMKLSSSDLEEQGIQSVDQIEMRFRIFESDDFLSTVETDMFTLTFNENAAAQAAPEGTVLVDQDGVKIISTGLDMDGIFGPEAKLYIENNTDQPLTVQVRDVSIDGFMIDPMMSSEVMPGKSVSDSMTFMKSSLEENGIEKIGSVELTFHFFNTDDWSSSFDIGPVTANF